MNAAIEYLSNKATGTEIAQHLSRCDADFMPPLSTRVSIMEYAQKIASKATRFEAWSGGTLIGLVAAYCNDQEKRIAYITSVSILREWTGKGIAARLLCQCIEHARVSGMRRIGLEVESNNTSAIKLYEKNGFIAGKATPPFISMKLDFKSREEHERQA